MAIYIEYVIVDNFIIDYFLLKASVVLSGAKTTFWRLSIIAFSGGVFALLYPLFFAGEILLFFIKFLFAILMVVLVGNYSSFRQFLFCLIGFFLYSFVTGGTLTGVMNLLKIEEMQGVWITLMILPICMVIYGSSFLFKILYRRRHVQALIYRVEMSLGNVTVCAKGFMDTGNGLYDKDSPVIMCGNKLAKKFITGNLKDIKLKRILVETVNGLDEKIAFSLQSFKIYIGDKVNIFNNVTLCVCKNDMGEGYEIILHPALLGEEYERTYMQVKKIS